MHSSTSLCTKASSLPTAPPISLFPFTMLSRVACFHPSSLTLRPTVKAAAVVTLQRARASAISLSSSTPSRCISVISTSAVRDAVKQLQSLPEFQQIDRDAPSGRCLASVAAADMAVHRAAAGLQRAGEIVQYFPEAARPAFLEACATRQRAVGETALHLTASLRAGRQAEEGTVCLQSVLAEQRARLALGNAASREQLEAVQSAVKGGVATAEEKLALDTLLLLLQAPSTEREGGQRRAAVANAVLSSPLRAASACNEAAVLLSKAGGEIAATAEAESVQSLLKAAKQAAQAAHDSASAALDSASIGNAAVQQDLQRLQAKLLCSLAELELLAAIHRVWAQEEQEQAGKAAAPSSPSSSSSSSSPSSSPSSLFPLLPKSQDSIAAELKGASALADSSMAAFTKLQMEQLQQHDAFLKEQQQQQQGQQQQGQQSKLLSAESFSELGRDLTGGAARPLRLLALLHFMTQRAVMAEGLLRSSFDLFDVLRVRGIPSSSSAAAGAASSASSSSREPTVQFVKRLVSEGLARSSSDFLANTVSADVATDSRLSGLPLSDAAAGKYSHLPFLSRVQLGCSLHLYGCLLRQWDKREEQGSKIAAAALQMLAEDGKSERGPSSSACAPALPAFPVAALEAAATAAAAAAPPSSVGQSSSSSSSSSMRPLTQRQEFLLVQLYGCMWGLVQVGSWSQPALQGVQ